MSAVIWCGIVAVWVFVLIPTWVRRGDLHWRRGPIGTAVVAEGPTEKRSRKAEREHGSRRRLIRRSRRDLSIEVEAMAEQDAQFPAEDRVYSASAPRARVAAAPSSSRLSNAMRNSFGTGGSGRKKPPLHVRRARRLVVLAALALGTLIAAIASGGLLIALNIVFDVALILYIRHLRNAARAKAARAAREKRARAARQAWEKAAAPERASGLDGWSAPAAAVTATETYEEVYTDDETEYVEYVQTEYAEYAEYPEGEYAEEAGYDAQAQPDVPGGIDLTAQQPTLIDLTDADTEELIAAQAS
jgi:hypothetical protein